MKYFGALEPIKVGIDRKDPILITNHDPRASEWNRLKFSIRTWWVDDAGTLKPGKGLTLPQEPDDLWTFVLNIVEAFEAAQLPATNITQEILEKLVEMINDSDLDPGVQIDIIAVEQRD